MLEDILVLDVSRILAGPWATQLLADFGARVIKIERPGQGDDTRRWGPPFRTDREGRATRDSAYFLGANRGKQSVTVDIATPRGQEIIRRIAGRADVVVENFKVGQLARYGLDYDSLQGINPALVYCSISGFGQSGPRADEAGYDAMIQAMGGLMSITGEPGAPPQKVGVAVSDLMAGMYAGFAILAGLHERNASGHGRHLDVSLFDCQLGWLANQAMNYFVGGRSPQRLGSAHPNIVPYQPFECADGYLMLAVGNDRQFARWCDLAGIGLWAADARFATNAARVENREVLVEKMAVVFRNKARDEWLRLLAAARIPAGPINDIAEAFADPQAEARGMIESWTFPDGGQVRAPANPLGAARGAGRPPLLGEHTGPVLAELGYSETEIQALRLDGVV